MKRLAIRWLSVVACGGGMLGCGSPPPLEPLPPLTVAEWKAMPVDKKYEAETFERLKDGEPTLATAEGWLAFQRTVVTPNRKREKINPHRRP